MYLLLYCCMYCCFDVVDVNLFEFVIEYMVLVFECNCLYWMYVIDGVMGGVVFVLFDVYGVL